MDGQYAELAAKWLARALEAETFEEQNVCLELAALYHKLILPCRRLAEDGAAGHA